MVCELVGTCTITGDMKREDKTSIGYELALETSGPVGGVALGLDGKLLDAQTFPGPKAHAADLLPTIDALCRGHSVTPSMLSCVYVSIGPGSFTGLRVAVAAARMLAWSIGTKLVGVPTLEVIAQNALDDVDPPDEVAVILDAKRGRVYGDAFRRRGGMFCSDGEPAEMEPGRFLASRDPRCAVLGDGILHHRQAVDAARLRILPESLCLPRAETVLRLGHDRASRGLIQDSRTLIPIYVRPPEAQEKWLQRQTRQSPTYL